jgi:hypothetical protein
MGNTKDIKVTTEGSTWPSYLDDHYKDWTVSINNIVKDNMVSIIVGRVLKNHQTLFDFNSQL